MKTIKLTASEIRSLEHFLMSNPCRCGCVLEKMQNSKKDCDECQLTKDSINIMKKLGLLGE